jgi:aryl-alcohol dehydrogenase-like predicted oxidoreductase
MKYADFHGLRVSRLGLGTVQFGLDYGIANRSGRVSPQDVRRILEKARQEGINFLDTSRGYGTSEEVLGKTLADLGGRKDFLLCSKLDLPTEWQSLSDAALREAARVSLYTSLEKLGLDRLPFYLLHTYDYMTAREGLVWRFVQEETARGTVANAGVSIAKNPAEALACLEDPGVKAIQIPYNLFDDRWHREGVLSKAASKGAAVFTRSCYLQGLLVMDDRAAAAKLPRSAPYKEKLSALARELKLDPKELAFRYVFSTPGIASTVMGLDVPAQLEENLALYGAEPLAEAVVDRIRGEFPGVPENIVNPSFWTAW